MQITVSAPYSLGVNSPLAELRDEMEAAGLLSPSDVLEGGNGFVRVTVPNGTNTGRIEAAIRAFNFAAARAVREKDREIEAEAHRRQFGTIEAAAKTRRAAIRTQARGKSAAEVRNINAWPE